MEIENDSAKEGILNDLVLSLKRLLADEYVLLNKTSYCLLDSSSPFANDNTLLFQKAYQELKKNAEAITELLKQQFRATLLSIDEIITNTRLKKTAFFDSKVAAVEVLLDDHLVVIRHLGYVLDKFSNHLKSEIILIVKQIKERHVDICNNCRGYLKEIFKYKSSSYVKNPA